MTRRVAIVGAGAAGLACAIAAARESARVTLLESKDRIGSSILATGNGRCNISNARVSASDYYNSAFVAASFGELPPASIHGFFSDLGLLMREEGEGRMYPLPNKASAVLDVLRFAVEELGVEVRTSAQVAGIKSSGAQKLVKLADGSSEFFDAVVVAVGGSVASSLLPDHGFLPKRQLLCGLRTDKRFLKGLDNVRVRCKASLVGDARDSRDACDSRDGRDSRGVRAVEEGEVQFRDYGISGVAVFNLSRFASEGDAVVLDFLPQQSLAETREMLEGRLGNMAKRDAVSFMSGVVLPQVARNVLRKARMDPAAPVRADQIPALADSLHGFDLVVEGFQAKTSQVSRGGFALDAFDPRTLESKLAPGVYVVGEALDVDGPCGGFNLHWAWTSGILAGRACAREA